MKRKMFKGCWLLSDLDGTLIPTPHKANGQYVPLHMSACFAPLKRWLASGGNLCVVTTADRRVFDQVYFSLRPFLNSLASPPSQSGELLLSLYTGASLYRCGRESIQHVADYCDPTHPAGSDTCMGAETSALLRELVVDIFLQMASDVIHQRAPMTAGWERQMSHRYQAMWRSFMRYLAKRYDERAAYCADLSMPRKPEYDARWGHLDPLIAAGERRAWMEAYLRTKRQLLVRVGIVRLEALRSSEELREFVWLKIGADACAQTSAQSLSDSKPAFCDPTAGRPVGSSISSGGGASGVCDGEAQRYAQLIIVGVPLSLYPHYFGPHAERFAVLGVHPIAQPNSVVFSKQDVGKGTTVNYLDRSLNLHGEVYRDRFRGMVDLSTAIALGDNPNTADRDLALIPTLPFVSVERCVQRAARHALLDACPTRAATAASAERGGGSITAPVDDRRLGHIYFAGGEEDGCARFLTELMDSIEADANRAGGITAPAHVAPDGVSPLARTFRASVAAAAEVVRAQHEREGVVAPSKL